MTNLSTLCMHGLVLGTRILHTGADLHGPLIFGTFPTKTGKYKQFKHSDMKAWRRFCRTEKETR